MKSLIFPSESYTLKNAVLVYDKKPDSAIGKLELLWSAIQNIKISVQLDRKEHKTLKKAKKKIREITRFKDSDLDSRVSLPGNQVLLLEDQEISILIKCLDSSKFIPAISDDVSDLYDIFEEAEEYDPPKPDIKLLADPG